MPESPLTFGSLFAGIGGFDLGFERAGMECRWQVEIDPFCQKVLAKHWPDVVRYSDVRECGKHNLEAVGLICGGFPCQPFSAAGQQRGEQDDRNLWPEMRRVVAELRPSWVIAENVPGIRNIYLDTVLSDLEDLEYAAITIDLPAVALGAPHIRHRLFIVAYSECDDNSIKVISNQIGRQNSTRSASRTSRSSEGCRIGIVPYTDRPEQGRRQQPKRRQDRRDAQLARNGTEGIVADAKEQPVRARLRENEQAAKRRRRFGDGGCSADVADPAISSTESSIAQSIQRAVSDQTAGARHRCTWATEPAVGRVADGIPNRVDRLRALGNAVVPQVAEWIGRRIVAVEIQEA